MHILCCPRSVVISRIPVASRYAKVADAMAYGVPFQRDTLVSSVRSAGHTRLVIDQRILYHREKESKERNTCDVHPSMSS